MKKQLIDLYLDYVNNWLTTGKMADYYGLDTSDLETLIAIGKKYHEENVTLQPINMLDKKSTIEHS